MELKKDAILEKSKTLSEQYLQNCKDIEENHKKPNTKSFRMKGLYFSSSERFPPTQLINGTADFALFLLLGDLTIS
jgi:hypothetical protein